MRIADISCGSGHILLAAARRIGLALAIVRTGDDQPSPSALREATRDVIRHCIYGVDLNPLAVELCKVALWLEAHVPGEPLGFLDHHIKCGNAIVGFVTQDELEKGVPDEAFKTLKDDDKDLAAAFRRRNKAERKEHLGGQKKLKLSSELQGKLDAVLARTRELSALPEHTPAEIATKKKQFDAANRQDAYQLRQIAAIPIAQFYQPKTAGNKPCLVTDAAFRAYLAGQTPQGQATASAWAIAERKGFFHWFLEFPEIMARGGFDCILGNPPYLGGQALSGTYGYPFCEYLRWQYAPTGLSDLVAFFLRRIFCLLSPNGFTAFITTNSIKDGDVRKDGLEQVIAAGGTINMAVRGIKWPGVANLVVSLVSIHRGEWKTARSLEGKSAENISARFEDDLDAGDPAPLISNEDQVYQGFIFLGSGFILDPQEVDKLTLKSPIDSKVIFPAINGQEINNLPLQKPSRYIINFADRTLDQAKQYPEAINRIEQLVKPIRNIDNRALYREKWWQFAEHRPGLRRATEHLDWCFVIPQTGKHFSLSRVPPKWAFLQTLYVFASQKWEEFAILQSSLHEIWMRKYSGSLKTDIRYLPTTCFLTFAFPAGQWQQPNFDLAAIGERYHEFRRDLMLRLWLGLTDIYNLFHDPDLETRLAKLFTKREKSPDWQAAAAVPPEHRATAGTLTPDQARDAILHLRTLHRNLDQAVLTAYGWGGQGVRNEGVGNHEGAGIPTPSLPDSLVPPILLGHDFQQVETLPENDRTRYTISPAARKELLKRLLKLNHERAAEEKNAALTQVASTTARKTSKKSVAQRPTEDLDLFRTAATKLTDGSTGQEFALPNVPRKDLGTPDAFLLVFVSEFLNLAGSQSTVRTLEAAFHLLRHRRSHLKEFIAVMGDAAEKWIDSNGDTLPNDKFVPFLTRIESNGWIRVERKDGVISKTSEFPPVPADLWRRFDIRAALVVIQSRPQVAEFILSDPESSRASKAFDQIKSA